MQVEDGVIGDEADTDTGSGTDHTHINKGNVQRNFRNTQEACCCILDGFGAHLTLQSDGVSIDILALTRIGVIHYAHPSVTVGTAIAVEATAEVDVTTPAYTQRLVKADVGFNDTCFDHHLTYRDIQLGNDTAQLVQTVLGFQRNNAVGAVVHGNGTALLGTGGNRGKQGGNIGGFGVVDLDQLTTQRGQFGDLLLRLQLLALAGGNFLGRSNQQHVTDLTLVQTLGLEYQIQRLVPGHVLQTQGDAALHSVTGHEVEVGKVGNQLQYRTHFDVLEVQRQFFTRIGELVGTTLFDFGTGHGLEADDQAVIGLIHQMFEEAGRLDADAGILSRSAGVDEVHRSGEVLHIQTYAQLIRQAGIGEVQTHATTLLLYIHTDGRVRQVDNHVTFTLLTALEVQTANGTATGHCCRTGYGRLISTAPLAATGLGRGARGNRCSCGIARSLTSANQDIQVVAIGTGSVGSQIGQVDDQAGAIIGLYHGQAAGITQPQLAAALAQTVLDARQVDGDTRRLIDGIALGRGRHRLIKGQLEFNSLPRQ